MACWKINLKRTAYLNKYSIGIEIHNSGHNNNYENFSFNQINHSKDIDKILLKDTILI